MNEIKKSDIRSFYSKLLDNNNLKIRTLDCIHTVLYQVFELAIEEEIILVNPASNAMREVKQTHNLENEKRKGIDNC